MPTEAETKAEGEIEAETEAEGETEAETAADADGAAGEGAPGGDERATPPAGAGRSA